jgi:AcrR family transcriptional regulator
MDEIAAEAGVGKPTLYRYFAGKDALFVAVFEHALDELEARLERVLQDKAGAVARLVGLATEIVPTFRQHLVSLRFLGDSGVEADLTKRRVFRERRKRIGVYIAQAIDEGVARGEVRPLDGAKVAQILIGMLWSATATSQAADGETGREVVDLLLHGLVPRGSAAELDGTAALPNDAGLHVGTAPSARLHGASV